MYLTFHEASEKKLEEKIRRASDSSNPEAKEERRRSSVVSGTTSGKQEDDTAPTRRGSFLSKLFGNRKGSSSKDVTPVPNEQQKWSFNSTKTLVPKSKTGNTSYRSWSCSPQTIPHAVQLYWCFLLVQMILKSFISVLIPFSLMSIRAERKDTTANSVTELVRETLDSARVQVLGLGLIEFHCCLKDNNYPRRWLNISKKFGLLRPLQIFYLLLQSSTWILPFDLVCGKQA